MRNHCSSRNPSDHEDGFIRWKWWLCSGNGLILADGQRVRYFPDLCALIAAWGIASRVHLCPGLSGFVNCWYIVSRCWKVMCGSEGTFPTSVFNLDVAMSGVCGSKRRLREVVVCRIPALRRDCESLLEYVTKKRASDDRLRAASQLRAQRSLRECGGVECRDCISWYASPTNRQARLKISQNTLLRSKQLVMLQAAWSARSQLCWGMILSCCRSEKRKHYAQLKYGLIIPGICLLRRLAPAYRVWSSKPPWGFWKYPFSCHQVRLSVIKCTAKL
jgi:hypothetical protein